MPEQLHMFVDFHGDFPIVDGMKEANGKELAELLATGLRAAGFNVGDPQAADFEYIVNENDHDFELHVGIDDFQYPDRWMVQACYSRRGFFGRLLDESDTAALARLLKATDRVLRQSSQIGDIRWFPTYHHDPAQLEKQTSYAGPTSDVPVCQPELATLDRWTNWHRRVCAVGQQWVQRAVVATFIGVFALGLLGWQKLTFVALVPGLLAGVAIFVGLGTGAWLFGLDLFQERWRGGRHIMASVGLLLLLLAGTFLCFVGLSILWVFVDHG